VAVYILKRLGVLVILLAGITFLTFSLIKTLPGDPAASLVGERADPAAILRIRQSLGVDKPFIAQYLGYVSLLVRGEMGRSYYTNRGVMDDIFVKLPNTARLGLSAMFIATLAGTALGFVSGLNRGTAIDRAVTALSLAGLSIPVFWSGLMIIIVFGLWLKILPPSGTGGMRYLILPAVTLALPAVAGIARICRTSIIETLDMPFVRVLEAKGLTRLRINFIHVLRNILIPLITVIGLDVGSYLNGAVLTETIFGWDGMGRYTVEGIIKRDYPVIMGCIITGTVIFVTVNALVDILYHYADPRVRLYGEDA
jgi:ABC-type dipeptide/oligopeptide/nickel transport system permease component